MSLAVLLLSLCLHAVDGPWWQPAKEVVTCSSGGNRTPRPGGLPHAPGASGVGKIAGTSPGAPPSGKAQGPDPRAGPKVSIHSQRRSAHRCKPKLVGPHWGSVAARAAVAAWWIDEGLSCRGPAAPPRMGCDPPSH